MDPDAAQTDSPMEARIARIESDVSHMRTDVADIKVDLRSLRDRVDGAETTLRGEIKSVEVTLRGEIKGLESTLRGEIKGVESTLRSEIESLRDGQGILKAEIASAKIWGLFLYIALAAANAGALARGFGWI